MEQPTTSPTDAAAEAEGTYINIDAGTVDDFCSLAVAWKLDEFGQQLVDALEEAVSEISVNDQPQTILITIKP